MTASSGGEWVVNQFLEESVSRVYCVPGESYLPVIDALYGVRDRVDLVSCRHESGAAMMAVASAHLTGQPGTALVTRGPGATNASIAVHIASQASIPLVMGVGQVSRQHLGREAFQEVDFSQFFAPIAKQIIEVRRTADIPAAVQEAYFTARTNRAGPVIVVLPEDILTDTAEADVRPSLNSTALTVGTEDIAVIRQRLSQAQRPLVIVGGTHWDDAGCDMLVKFAETYDLPVCSAWRRNDVFDNYHEHYVGSLGLNTAEALWQQVEAADCLFVLGARLDDPTTRSYTVPNWSSTSQAVIHVHPDREQLNRHGQADVVVEAYAIDVLKKLCEQPLETAPREEGWCGQLRDAYSNFIKLPSSERRFDIADVMSQLNAVLTPDTIVTVDGGNFSMWPQRFRRYCRPGRLIAPLNGAMGYGVPAGIAASLTYPDKTVVTCVGDGGMMMTGMELATAVKYGAKPIVLVFNNQRYGTIEMHQRRHYPERPHGNDLVNPNFAEFAQSFGAHGERVTSHEEFTAAFQRATGAARAAVIELCMDPGDLSVTYP